MIFLLYITFGAFIVAGCAPLITRRFGTRAPAILALFPSSVVLLMLTAERPADTDLLQASIEWIPSLGINLTFYVDGLSALFVLLITGIGAVVQVYSGAYMQGAKDVGRFHFWLLVFMGSMIGVVTSGNLITLFVFWELTSISSYFLIGFNHEDATSRQSAMQALLVTSAGGLSLLAGFILVAMATGSMDLGEVLSKGEVLRSSPLYVSALLLILAGAFTKSAQVPFHFWLPNAMAAPSPVSAYLHSATMVKAGVFLLARLNPVLNGTDVFHVVVGLTGAVTMVLGALLAIAQRDLKKVLAYTTVSALGTLVLLLGIGTEAAVQAAIVYLLAHALYKGALFLAVGIIDHETGTRDVEMLGGLRSALPRTAFAAVLAALSMAGLPPMLGFISKELLYEAKIAAPFAPMFVTLLGVTANVLTVATAGMIILRTFWGRRMTSEGEIHDPPWAMWGGVLLLATLGFLAGLFAEQISSTIVSPAVAAVHGESTTLKLALWHGINPVLVLSMITLAAGAGIYLLHRPIRAFAGRWNLWKAENVYEAGLTLLLSIARSQTRLLQNGKLSHYITVTFVATLVLVGLPIVINWSHLTAAYVVKPSLLPSVIAGVTAISAFLAVRARTRLGAIIALGVVGFGMAVIFLLYSAPDVALTQFAVETLTVVLLMMVVGRLPQLRQYSSRGAQFGHAMLAAVAGCVMTFLVLIVTSEPARMSLAGYYSDTSFLVAKGRNIVNVILVDFRAMDTLGEITVLAVGALGAYALMKLTIRNEGEE